MGPVPAPAGAPGRGDRRPQPGADVDKKKGKKGRKTVGQQTDTADIRNLRTLEQIEEVVDQAVVPTGSLGRRRRRPDEREDDTASMKPTRTAADGPVVISEGMTVREFAERLGVKVKDLLALLFRRGILANINHVIEPELGVKLAEQFGFEAKVMTFEEEVQATTRKHEAELPEETAATGTVPRAPVVTIMGHVDHGKTSLLDQIRKSKIVDTEFGGITQHIGAYHVDVGHRQIVFLDTPGHEAFTLMRARGAKVTDVVILVVAADDGVMPQTLEAIDHARAAGVPILVALNKIDKPNANPDRVKQQLSDKGLMAEDWGGQTVVVPVSALKGEGINELLEMVLLTSDMLELKANPDRPAQGVVLEARKETGRGVVATVLVHNGTLKVGDIFVSGSTWGRVRSMADDRGRRAKESGPATAAEVTGFDDVPEAGDTFQVVGDEQKARGIVEFRQLEARKRDLLPQAGKLTLEQLFSRIETGEVKDLGVVLKADVQGSVEVLREAIEKLGTAKVKISVLHSGVGAISTNDVLLASASKAIIVGFNVRPERNAVELAEKEQVEIRLHTIIYELLDEMKKAMVGLLEPTFKEVARGRAEVREIFKVPKIGTIAGCHVVDGSIPRTAGVRVVRDGRVVHEGKIASLKRFKEDASEVRAGFDCGIGLERFQDVKPGDVIEAYVKEEVAPTLA
jgi:translation initiation factor IF-2